ncbi:MAG: pyrroline-5-carboxylate reductase [Planctomycetota bacterium]|nr:MAG: pyrroline-5-carboxylate reductase [Planctomycetota bacterium]
MSYSIGFIGAGKMATALAIGFLKAGLVTSQTLRASDVYAPARAAFSDATKAIATASNDDVLKASRVIILAVKPQQMEAALREAATVLTPDHLVISIAAGVPVAKILKWLGRDDVRIVRVMPNTPALVQAGASAFCIGGLAIREDAQLTQQLFSAVGVAVETSESLLDAVTGLSGSGPAYVFQIIEALSDAGVRVGLPRAIATQLAAQTLYGAARMLLETGEHPGVLKDAVTSPGGTTIAGLHELEKGGLRAALINAVVAATSRSVELGK